MNNILLIYHNEDNDGVFSGAIIYNYLISSLHKQKENIVLLPVKYSDIDYIEYNKDSIRDLMTYEMVIMTDISFHNIDLMKKLYKHYGDNFIWIDHHAPIIRESINYKFNGINGLRDTTRSAILCAYKFFYDQYDNNYINHTVPDIYRILSAYDSWTWEQEEYTKDYVFYVNKGIECLYKLDFNKVYNFVNIITDTNDTSNTSLIATALVLGEGICNYEDMKFANIIESSGEYDWTLTDLEGNIHSAVMLVLQGPTTSSVFKSVKNKVETGIVFKHELDNKWSVSVYNTNENGNVHIGDFCKQKYAGGGHAGCGGFIITDEVFNKMMSEKNI